MTIQEVKQTHKPTVTAWRNGYMPRFARPKITPYSGKYGTGYAVETPIPPCRTIHLVTYYIRKEV